MSEERHDEQIQGPEAPGFGDKDSRIRRGQSGVFAEPTWALNATLRCGSTAHLPRHALGRGKKEGIGFRD